MGQQTNRVQKKKRREIYHKRKNAAARVAAEKPVATKAPAKAAAKA